MMNIKIDEDEVVSLSDAMVGEGGGVQINKYELYIEDGKLKARLITDGDDNG